ncbi:hypothetical protein OLMES_2953 [Oleiphilus messinensis]|uniref:Uncharacterized protein n=2 Tax=Oleiphilus messinensis TaxID=141451 RepID=A0A1Y0I901_9GAMM|nr:hypothetical protein OLMES_2953 [Oleiphilus messinensis]
MRSASGNTARYGFKYLCSLNSAAFIIVWNFRQAVVGSCVSKVLSIREFMDQISDNSNRVRQENASEGQYDERHYFVIPYLLSETGFKLQTMRYLPNSVPGVNDLPKRRIFHLPNTHFEAALREYMVGCAVEICDERAQHKKHALERLAESIDSIHLKLTCGIILIAGAVAILNPLVGARIAAMALVPGVGGLLSKHVLKRLGQKLAKSQANQKARLAKASVLQQFSEVDTLRVVNPVLQELELMLRTTEAEHDPLIDPNLADGSIPELGNERWRPLTEAAVYHCYRDIVNDKSMHTKAGLGPEDLRWLEVLFKTHVK